MYSLFILYFEFSQKKCYVRSHFDINYYNNIIILDNESI